MNLNPILVLIVTLLSLTFANAQSAANQDSVKEREILSKKHHRFCKKKPSTKASYHRKADKLTDRQKAYLRKYPNDLIVRWNLVDTYLAKGQVGPAFEEMMVIVEFAPKDMKAFYARDFTISLSTFINKNQDSDHKEYKEACCFFEKIRKEDGMWEQECVYDISPKGICGCED